MHICIYRSTELEGAFDDGWEGLFLFCKMDGGTCVVHPHLGCPIEAIWMRGHGICFPFLFFIHIWPV